MAKEMILNIAVAVTKSQAKKLLSNNGEKITAAVTRIANGTINQHLKVVGTELAKRSASSALKTVANVNPVTGAITMVSTLANNAQTAYLQKSVNQLTDITKDLAAKVSSMSIKLDSVRNLSWLNAGLGMVNLGVSAAGFAYVGSQLQAMKKVVQESKEILNQVQAEAQKLVGFNNLTIDREYNEICMNIIAVMNDLVKEPFDRYKKDEVRELLNHTAAFLNQVIELFNKRIIPGELGCNIIIPLSIAYASLVKLYSAEYYFYTGEKEFPPNYNEWMAIFDKLQDEKFKRRIYNHYLTSSDRFFVEEELRTILFECDKMLISARTEIEDCRILAQVFEKENYHKLVYEEIPSYAEEQVKYL